MSTIIDGTNGITVPTPVTAANGGTGLTSVGTSGNVLTSNGTAWVSQAASGSTANVQTFTSSGTWTKPSLGANSRVYIQCWGGGGSGSKAVSGSATSGGAGGGGGGYNEGWFTLSQLGSTETVTIGAGGSAVSTANVVGNNGGNTSLGSWVTAYGGGGGGAYIGGSGSTGGGGGGQISAGYSGSTLPPTNPYPAATSGGYGSSGRPWLGIAIGCASFLPPGSGNSGSYFGGGYAPGVDGFFHGGGGGGCCTLTSIANGSNGGGSVWGGGGGGGVTPTGTPASSSGGTSVFGGAGGASGTSSSGTAGTQPGGGGGATITGASTGAGAAGKIIVTVFPG
jgi:hypothetical protein